MLLLLSARPSRDCSSPLSSLLHTTLGLGTPVAEHCSDTSVPVRALTSAPTLVVMGSRVSSEMMSSSEESISGGCGSLQRKKERTSTITRVIAYEAAQSGGMERERKEGSTTLLDIRSRVILIG